MMIILWGFYPNDEVEDYSIDFSDYVNKSSLRYNNISYRQSLKLLAQKQSTKNTVLNSSKTMSLYFSEFPIGLNSSNQLTRCSSNYRWINFICYFPEFPYERRWIPTIIHPVKVFQTMIRFAWSIQMFKWSNLNQKMIWWLRMMP